MKRYALCLLVALSMTPVGAQDAGGLPRVVVLPLVNGTGESRNAVVAQTTTDTVSLTIRLLEGYALVPFDGFRGREVDAPPSQGAALVAERLSAESVLFGAVTRGEQGEFIFELDVYDRRLQSVTAETRSVATSLFGVFDAADRLVAEAVGAFSGVRIGFGSVRLNRDAEFDYRVYLDGNIVGENVSALDRILIGERRVRVTQLTAGMERTIYEERFFLDEGESKVISLTIPKATPAELARAAELRAEISQALDAGVDLSPVEPALGELQELLTVAPGALTEPEETLSHLRRRHAIVSAVQGLESVNFRAAAEESAEVRNGGVGEIVRPVLEAYESAVAAAVAGPLLEELRADARRSSAAVSGLLALERAGTGRDEAVLVTRFTEMIGATHRLLRAADIAEGSPPYNQVTGRSEAFMSEYDRAVQRQRPWWHWAAGIVGAAGTGTAAWMQFSEIPASEGNRNSALEDYEAAQSVEEASEARGEVESEQQALEFGYLARNVGLGVSALLPIALVARTISAGRPRRAWQDYEESAFRRSMRAASLDYRERRWEEGESAVLILGDEEAVSGTGIEGTQTTPVYLQVEPGEELRFSRETGGITSVEEYHFHASDGLTLLQVGGRE
ncbi:MAG: hypothetical protein WD492_09160 [Alkalispirochaeta sp.]